MHLADSHFMSHPKGIEFRFGVSLRVYVLAFEIPRLLTIRPLQHLEHSGLLITRLTLDSIGFVALAKDLTQYLLFHSLNKFIIKS